MTAAVKPWMFLDLDGVLNRYGPITEIVHHDLHTPGTYADWKSFTDVVPLQSRTGIGFTLQISPSLVADLTKLAEIVDVVWLTTWEHSAPEVVAPLLGLPDWPLASPEARPIKLKMHRLAVHLEANPRPWIWIDDESATDWNVTCIVDGVGPLPHLTITPDPTRGIGRDDIAANRDFVRSLED